MTFWHRVIFAAVLFLAVILIARLVDWWLSKRNLPPEIETRYRVLRRGITAAIIFVGLLSALLVIPGVRAIAGGLLASSAVFAVVIGFASQRTLGNFVAGLLIAISQPVRLGDRVEYEGEVGVVEDIGLTYTFIRTTDHARLVVPNEKLASDTIRNSSIRGRRTFAEVTVQVPLTADLDAALDGLREETASERDASVFVSSLNGAATVTILAGADSEDSAAELEYDLRRRAHGRLRALGVWG
jgi:small-conductance mechanosensitive channel